jgi:hypothetical protein
MRLLTTSVAARMNCSGSHHVRLLTTHAAACIVCGCSHHLWLLHTVEEQLVHQLHLISSIPAAAAAAVTTAAYQ